MVGGVVSSTVTWNDPVAVLPDASVALHDTVVVPKANVEPEVGVQVTVGEAGLASAAVAVQVATAPAGLVASWVTPAGSDNVGGVVSQ